MLNVGYRVVVFDGGFKMLRHLRWDLFFGIVIGEDGRCRLLKVNLLKVEIWVVMASRDVLESRLYNLCWAC